MDNHETNWLLAVAIIVTIIILSLSQQSNVCNEKCNNLPAHNVSTGEILK